MFFHFFRELFGPETLKAIENKSKFC